MNATVHYAHDGTYLLGYGSVGCAVFPSGAIIEGGYPPGWPIPPCPSARHRWNIHTRQWDCEALPEDEAWAQVRHRRDQLLAACDWVVFRAQERGEPVPQPWRAYRQALRDVTQQSDPTAIVWPEPPA